ncbi:MAG TPA: YhcN/YlaJ family sporulation lipoprotein [Pseudogracilibacillus sp.]|nr:YhcN/YlaJ family sporulation lipoprotein [Pseudogracilibacillus sp.]
MKSKALSFVIAFILVLVGCQNTATKTTDESQRGNDTFERTRTTHDTDRSDRSITENLRDRNFESNNRASNNRQDRYDVSKEAADRIVEEIPDIDRAYVLTTRNNAYVAAMLDRKNMTNKDNLSYNDRDKSSAGMNVRNVNDRNVRNRTVNEGDSNERRQDNHMANKRDNVRHDMMGKRDVESDEVTDEVKNQIADIVQEVDNNIDNVYVSTNPDFFDLSENYVNDVDAGKPVRGFFDQIGNTIERIFPQNKR